MIQYDFIQSLNQLLGTDIVMSLFSENKGSSVTRWAHHSQDLVGEERYGLKSLGRASPTTNFYDPGNGAHMGKWGCINEMK